MSTRDGTELPSSLPRSDLPNHPLRGAGAVGGWAGIAFSAPFVGAGGLMLALALDVFGPYEPRFRRGTDAPWYVIAAVGLVFAASGLLLGAVSARQLVRRRRAARAVGDYPGQPWMWEHPWDGAGARDDEGTRPLTPFLAAIGVSVFLVPFHWALLQRGATGAFRWLLGAVVLLFDLFALGLWVGAFGETARRLRHGRSLVRWERFPIPLGAPLRLVAEPGRSLPVGSPMRAELRCVREEVVETPGGARGRRRRHVVHRVLWRETRELTRGPGAIVLDFDLPGDAPGTALLSPQPTYWELALTSEIPGADFAGTYLLPVYAASARRGA